jgi:hypothetical protein
MATEKHFWQINLEKLAQEILKKTRTAQTEEDIKMRVEPLLRRIFSDIGVDVDIVAYEKTTALTAKRMDAVYGYVIIEYKGPGKLATDQNIHNTETQLKSYLEEEAQRHGIQAESFLEKAIGIALDDRRLLFVRYSKTARILFTPVPIQTDQARLFPKEAPQHGFQFQGPFPINASSLASLLIYARSAARRPLTAQDMAKVFGPDQGVAQVMVSELYSAVMRGQRQSRFPRVVSFYEEWNRIFGAVYGEKLEKAENAVEETATLYQLPAGIRLKPLLFAIHTFYALLMKLIAIELLALQQDSGVSSFVEGLPSLNDDQIKAKFSDLESGIGFNDRGISNFLEADFFSWYLDVWTGRLSNALRGVIRALADFEPATPILEPDWTRDLLQKLYELLVPKILRHGLGEYYTPDWLAGYLVDKACYDGAPGIRFLDPACGSGTFLVQAIHRAAFYADNKDKAGITEIGRSILNNIIGFDLNPLAVLAARTNYLIAFSRFIPFVRPFSIPVYLCDSVVPPDRDPADQKQAELFSPDTVVFRTKEHDFIFPISMKNKDRIDQFTGLIMIGLRAKMPVDKFKRLLAEKMKLKDTEQTYLCDVYARIKKLDDEKRDGIWAHYIKNAFAPVYVAPFDFVIGNPPWIRWGYLSEDYRRLTLKLWKNYGLFSLKGHATRLGGGEKDFSMLFTYVCADRYLKNGGVLGFVITQEVFKSKGAGEGFRRFALSDQGPFLKILSMEDMVHLQPFQAANKTSIFTMQKGQPTQYPVPVIEWRRKPGIGAIAPECSLAAVLEKTERTEMQAVPVDAKKPVSSWQTAKKHEIKRMVGLKGKNPYTARLGARVEPYGVFWLKLKEVRPDGNLVVENQHDRGKREIKRFSSAIEPDLVYPAVSGGDIVRFGIKEPFCLLIVQDPAKRAPYPETWMIDHAPLTYAYLMQFKSILLSRGSRVVKQFAESTEFYAMYGIGEYSFAHYRVVWKRMANAMSAVVLTAWKTPFGTKPVIATDTTSLFTAKSTDEAHYLCAIMNSKIVNDFIRSFSSGGRGFGAPSAFGNLAIPPFNAQNRLHSHLAALSKTAHNEVERGRDITMIAEQIDQEVEKLWNLKS